MVQPVISDTDRSITYNPVASAGPFPVPFPLFDEHGSDLIVALDNVPVGGWTFSGAREDGFYGAPNTWVNGSLTFPSPISGALRIDGNRAPRRIAQFAEGRGVPARDLNVELNILTAIARELWMRIFRLIAHAGEVDLDLVEIDQRLDGHDSVLTAHAGLIAQNTTTLAAHGNRLNGHDTILAGHSNELGQHAAQLVDHEDRLLPIPEILAARDQAKSWATQPYGQPVVGAPDDRSALHWQAVAHQWATEAEAWATSIGALIFDFGPITDPLGPEEDWGSIA